MVSFVRIRKSKVLFLKKGRHRQITIVIDNATWHSELTENSKPARRSMRKDQIIDWLENHGIEFDSTLRKSELLEIAFDN